MSDSDNDSNLAIDTMDRIRWTPAEVRDILARRGVILRFNRIPDGCTIIGTTEDELAEHYRKMETLCWCRHSVLSHLTYPEPVEWAGKPLSGWCRECLPAHEFVELQRVDEDRDIEALKSENARLRAALENAAEAIHSEYCGKTHHKECLAATKALRREA